MTKYFNLLSYKELLELDQDGKISIPDNNYLELVSLKANVHRQIAYNRKEVYCSLVENYLNNLITPTYFRSKCREMTLQDLEIAYRILQDFEKLEVLTLSKNLNQFHQPMDEISNLCMEYDGDTSESDFYSWVKSEFLKIPKDLSD